jgi:hypothetical protein
MTFGRSSRWVLVSAIGLTFVLEFRPLLFSSILGEALIHRKMPEAIDIPYINRNQSEPLDYKVTTMPTLFAGSMKNTTNLTDLSTTVSSTSTQLGPIFYNVYVPEKRKKATLAIIEEQIRFRNETDPEAPILYTLIGSNKVDTSIQRFCQPNCTKREYLKKGNEIDTLQALWEYCQERPSEIVTYIHDKGSFHPSGANRKARGVGTKAALECRQLMLQHHAEDNIPAASNTTNKQKKAKSWCSICSYRFYSFPVYHARANMWTAHCSYIRNLLPPQQYESKVLNMYESTVNHTVLGPTKYACIRPHDVTRRFLGLERYAMERWALNHPDVQPCDSQSKQDIRHLKRDKKPATNFTPKLVPAPQKRAKTSGIASLPTSWERLAGRLFEWDYLYQKKPPKSSWVWKYYKGYEKGTKQFLKDCSAIKKETIQNLTQLNVTINGQPLMEVLKE